MRADRRSETVIPPACKQTVIRCRSIFVQRHRAESVRVKRSWHVPHISNACHLGALETPARASIRSQGRNVATLGTFRQGMEGNVRAELGSSLLLCDWPRKPRPASRIYPQMLLEGVRCQKTKT